MRDVMRNQRDQADRAFGVHRPQPLDDPRRGQAEAALAQHFQRDEFALSSLAAQSAGDEDFACAALLVDRRHASRAVHQLAIDAERARAGSIEHFDDPAAMRFPLGIGIDPQQDAGADAWSGRLFSLQAGAANSNARRLARLGPIDGTRDQFAIAVSLDDVGDHHRRQGALASENLAAARDGAVGLEVLDEQFEFGPGRALDAERARHVTFGHASGRLHAVRRGCAGEKGEHLVA